MDNINIGKFLLLNIGINKYPHLPSEDSLSYCVNDAKSLHEGYSKYNYEYKKLLLDSTASRIDILKSIDDLIMKARDNDYIVLSFSGHGVANNYSSDINSKNCFICPYDFDPEYVKTTGISFFEIINKIKQIKAQSKLLIFDACHSGGALRRKIKEFKLREIKSDELLGLVTKGSGNAIITACNSEEKAEEKATVGKGVFTHFFIDVLSNFTIEKYIPFNQAYKEISLKVQKETENRQNPQKKCDNNDFVIPVIPKEKKGRNGKVKLDLTILPTPKETQIKDFDKFEEKIIFLLQNKRIIELDKILKGTINNAYENIRKLIAPPHKSENSEIIKVYENCRQQIQPIILIFKYILNYGEESLVSENLDILFKFEELSHGTGGLTAILQIPQTLISEIIMKIIDEAYNKRNVKVLKKLFTPYSSYFSGMSIPIIFSRETWHSEMFHRDITRFFRYLFSEEEIKKDIFMQQRIRNLCEINFLFDAYSSKTNGYYSFPLYLIFDKEIPDIIASKLKNKDYSDFVQELFEIGKNDFIDLIIKRQNRISSWENFNNFSFSPRNNLEKFESLKLT